MRQAAVMNLAEAGRAGVSGLIRALAGTFPLEIRVQSAAALGRIGPEAECAVEPLCGCLCEQDDSLRWHAAFALGRIGVCAVTSLLRVLSATRDPEVLRACTDALGRIGPAAVRAVTVLKGLVKSGRPPVQHMAGVSALARITGKMRPALRCMVKLLAHPEEEVRREALERIGEVRSAAQAVQKKVKPFLKDPAASVRAEAALTLVKIEAEPGVTVEAVAPLLQDGDPGVRASAAMALHALAHAAGPVVDGLRALQQDEVKHVAVIARAAVEEIEKNTETGGEEDGQETR